MRVLSSLHICEFIRPCMQSYATFPMRPSASFGLSWSFPNIIHMYPPSYASCSCRWLRKTIQKTQGVSKQNAKSFQTNAKNSPRTTHQESDVSQSITPPHSHRWLLLLIASAPTSDIIHAVKADVIGTGLRWKLLWRKWRQCRQRRRGSGIR